MNLHDIKSTLKYEDVPLWTKERRRKHGGQFDEWRGELLDVWEEQGWVLALWEGDDLNKLVIWLQEAQHQLDDDIYDIEVIKADHVDEEEWYIGDWNTLPSRPLPTHEGGESAEDW